MSSRNISVERLYSLGQYQNIKFVDTINDIPNDLSGNTDFLHKLKLLQMVEMELAYREYIKLAEKVNQLKIDDAIPLLHEIKLNTIDELKTILTKGD